MDVRRIRPDEHERAGDVCVAAYDPLLTGAEDDYRERLHDVATRDAAGRGVGGGASTTGWSGSSPTARPGSPWREIGRDDEGEFRMLAVDPAAQGTGAGHGPRAAVRGARPRARRDRDGAVVAGDDDGRPPDLRAARLRRASPVATGRRVAGVDLLAFSKAL